jgi:hypothetical protein
MDADTSIRMFFDAYDRATGTLDLTFLGTAYGETFMFVTQGGVQAVKRDDFLKVVPRRAAFFRSAGHVASTVDRIDETHTMVRAAWSLRFEPTPEQAVVVAVETTYVLRRHDGSWQIVFQLDHHDLAKRMEAAGVRPQVVG